MEDEFVKVDIWLHSNKESSRDAAEKADLKGEALNKAMYLGYEHKLTFCVDRLSGDATLIAVDDFKLSQDKLE